MGNEYRNASVARRGLLKIQSKKKSREGKSQNTGSSKFTHKDMQMITLVFPFQARPYRFFSLSLYLLRSVTVPLRFWRSEKKKKKTSHFLFFSKTENYEGTTDSSCGCRGVTNKREKKKKTVNGKTDQITFGSVQSRHGARAHHNNRRNHS